MVMNVLPKNVFDFLGHDGSEIIDPTKEDPYKRKGFHTQELVAYALSRYHYPVEIVAVPVTDYGNSQGSYDNSKLLTEYLGKCQGVLIGYREEGKKHAVAWDKELVLDPVGYKYPLEEFAIESFFAFF